MWYLLLLASSLAAGADFESQVRPILEQNCISCHREGNALGGLRLDDRQAAGKAIVPSQPQQSSIYTRVLLPAADPKAMPPGNPLPAASAAILREWIEQGAPWPAGVKLSVRPKTQESSGDDLELVRKLREQFVRNAPAAADMKPYRAVIPGTEVPFEMVPIPGGEFVMGGSGKPDEGPAHKVALEPFWMGKHEVTWDEYQIFMYPQPPPVKDPLIDAVSRPTKPYVEMSFGMGIQGYPAISMTHHAANKYCQWLSAKTGHFYRLPTEAEWEYACRAGTRSEYSFGDEPAKLADYAWFYDNSNGKYQKVGQKKPNPWGLHDMHGNVMEWTLDQYIPNFYRTFGDMTAFQPWAKSTQPYPHAVRGGSWNDDPEQLRCAARVGSDASWKMQDPQLPKSIWYHTDAQWLGFRIVRPLKVPSVEEIYQSWNNGVEKE